MKPCFSSATRNFQKRSGSEANNTFDPSSGGIGTKLNTASTMFAYTIMERRIVKSDVGSRRTRIANADASSIFAIGPAAPTSAGPHFPPRKLYGLYGTGFAYANKNVPPDVHIRRIGSTMVPKKSMCASGFSVSRPSCFAVGSPSRYAIHPCAYS